MNDWQGSVQDGVYQLTDYTGDLSHIIVPNEADFEKAGKSTNGLQVGISSGTIKSFFSNLDKTFAFSKTNSQKVKAIGADWSETFAYTFALSKFDGSNLDVSNVTNMKSMFSNNQISDLTSLTNWNVSNVTNMKSMFDDNEISDLTPLTHWDTSKVTDMSQMFFGIMSFGGFNDHSISDLTPLANWDTSKVTNMSQMFGSNKISNLTGLTSWNTSKVTDMSDMFTYNRNISDLTPLKNWDTSNVTNMRDMFSGNKISDLTPLANWDTGKVVNMGTMFEHNSISNLTGLANWNISKVTSMGSMFANNPDLIDLKPIANWNISDINAYYGRGFYYGHDFSSLFKGDTKLDLTNINNTPLMQSFLEKPIMLQSSTFIINNVDFVTRLVKATTGKDVPTLTNTATRTIVFNIPHAAQETVTQHIYYKAIAPVQVNWPAPPASISISEIALVSRGRGTLVPYDPNNPHHVTPDSPNPVDPDSDNPYSPKIIKTYPVKDPDWQLDTSQTKPEDVNVVNGRVYFKAVKIPHINGYKAYIVPNKLNPAMFMVSFIAVPSENKPSTPVEVAPSKPSAPADNTNKPIAPVDKPSKSADDLKQHAITESNGDDSSWTMPTDVSNSTYTVEVPANSTVDLSDLVIAQPVHAQTRTQIHVNKRFKLSKKRVVKHLTHRKNTVKSFKKYSLQLRSM